MTALFPGSFDPFTLGHLNLLIRGAKIFDKIVIAILHNSAKQPLFTVDERIVILKDAITELPGVQIELYNGLLVELAKSQEIRYILRGVRSEADCAYELPMAMANGHLGQGLETVLLVTDPAYAYVSSALVREVAIAGYANNFDDKTLEQWVSPVVRDMLRKKFKKNINS